MTKQKTKQELLQDAYSAMHRGSDLLSAAWTRQQLRGAELEESYMCARAALCALEELRNEALGTRGKVGP